MGPNGCDALLLLLMLLFMANENIKIPSIASENKPCHEKDKTEDNDDHNDVIMMRMVAIVLVLIVFMKHGMSNLFLQEQKIRMIGMA
jgi:hypothetical protein